MTSLLNILAIAVFGAPIFAAPIVVMVPDIYRKLTGQVIESKV